jgi:DNA-binding transcriptional regulator WhiA
MPKLEIPKEILSEMSKDYNNGLSVEKLVSKYENKYTEWQIRRRLVENGTPMRHRAALSRKYDLDQPFFNVIDTEEKAYWLGMMFADGSIYSSKKGKMFHLTLQGRDLHHVKKFKKALKAVAPVHHQKKKNHYGLFIWSGLLYDSLERAGCIRQKGAYIRLPKEDILPKSLVRHFVRGYFDGNGCFSWSRSNFRVAIRIVSNTDFVADLKEIFTSEVGVKHYYHKEPVEYQDYPGRYYTNLDFGTYEGALGLYHYMYDNATVFLERKKEKFNKFIKES